MMSLEETLLKDFRIQQDLEARFKHLLPDRSSLQRGALEGLAEQIRQQELHHVSFLHEQMESHSELIRQMSERENEFVRMIERAQQQFISSASAFRPYATFNASLARSVRDLLDPMVSFSDMACTAADNMQKLLEPVRQMRSALELIPNLNLPKFHGALDAYIDGFWIQWNEEERKAFKIFAKFGLVGLEAHLTRNEIRRILHLHKTKGRNGVLKFIFNIFKKNNHRFLNALARKWWQIPYMEKRKKTIKSALRAHKDGKYELSIPTLLPCIDGIAELIMSGTASSGRTIQVKEVAEMYHAQEDASATECILYVVNRLLYRKVDFKKQKRSPSSANRHGILHGRVIGYGTELNSYRVILLLDTMVNIALEKPQCAPTAATP